MAGLVGGCAIASALVLPRDAALRDAAEKGWQTLRVDTDRFVISLLSRPPGPPSERLAIYIEGDGFAWAGRTRPSSDPTPKNPVSLRLALEDSTTAVVYMARPCQYTMGEERKGCDARYWTTHRLSEEVIAALDAAIDRVKAVHGASRIELIGYSGGGAAAVLLASRRIDVDLLVTVAANLDTAMWTDLQGLTPLLGSLNPIHHAAAVRAIPQVHLAGGGDDTVPVAIAEHFVAALGPGARAEVRIEPGFDHACCWGRHWRETIAGIRRAQPLLRQR